MRILKLRIERVLATLFIPYAIINISKASKEMFITAIFMQTLFFIAIYIGTKEARKTLIEDLKNGELDEYIEEVKAYIEPIKELIEAVNTAYKSIKKEAIKKQTKTTKLKDAF